MGGTTGATATAAVRGRRAAVATLLVAVVLLTGCVQVRHDSTIAKDLTGTTNLRFAISRDTLATINALAKETAGMGMAMPPIVTGDDFVKSIEADVKKLGGVTVPFESATYVGADITFSFKSLDEMAMQINTLLGSSGGMTMMAMGGGMMRQGMMSADEPLVALKPTSTDTRVRIEGKVDPLSSLGGPDGIGSLSPELAKQIMGDPDAVVALMFTLPGAILDSDPAATRDGNTVSWEWHIGTAKATFFAESDRR